MGDPLFPRHSVWPAVDHLIDADTLAVVERDAAAADVRGAVADEVMRAIKDTGYCGLPIPAAFGGSAASLVECCAVQRALGRVNPGLAVALNMHLFSVGVLVEHWRARQDESWLLMEAVATQRRLVANAFAEPALAGALSRSTCVAVRGDTTWTISGTKTPCSLARRADLVCFQAEVDGSDGELVLCLVPLDAEGVRAHASWDALGMRCSESDTLVFEECRVPDQLVFHRGRQAADGAGTGPLTAGLVWFCLTIAAVYLGLAERALGETAAGLHQAKVRPLGAGRHELTSYQAEFGALVSRLAVLDAACESAARVATTGPGGAAAALDLALAVKHEVCQGTHEIVNAACGLTGAGAYRNDSPMSRLLRDSVAARFHPPTRQATTQILGRRALGLPAPLELFEVPADHDRLLDRINGHHPARVTS
ncbi:acyl-CoA dehydrogenase family protein [Actinosynnema sp. NPDC023587]|uniref:acyl-CoA dehydrogenase family protein n=1 Tax=Actinosynnema sp. NPDC023587 TaxID=3154695 RepID=UPI0033C4B75E